MSNYTFVRLTKLDGIYAASVLDFHQNETRSNSTADSVLLVIEDHNYSYRSTSTIVLMVTAWILLILGFVFCCCAECFGVSVWRGKKKENTSQMERGGGGAGGGVATELNELERDRANHTDPTIEICRRCPPDYEAESLPSYTIVSGLPTYDDALEEFRKAGIILTPTVVPIIKIFESQENANGNGQAKENAVGYSLVETNLNIAENQGDDISLNNISCQCGGGNTSTTSNSMLPSYSAALAAVAPPQVIELSPEHLASLSQKRLSLQISFNNSVRRPSRPGPALRKNLLRSRFAASASERDAAIALPPLHRSTSSTSLSNERQLLDQRLRHLHHRGSLY